MHGVLLFILLTSQICCATVLFRLRRTNANSSLDSSYFIGTMHVTQDLIWPYLSPEILDVIAASDEIWLEHDFTNPAISKHIYECAVDKMTPQLQARIRAKTWPEFLNETNADEQSLSPDSTNTTQWRQWFINKQVVSSNYLWRNRTIDKDIIFDHRIILEGYQRNKSVSSLESVPNDCFQLGTLMNKTDSSKPMDPTLQTLLSRVYNCGLVDENFIAEIYKYLDLIKMKHRNEQMVRRIRKLLQRAPHRKYLFAVGAAHLFGDISIVRMLRDQFRNDYFIEPVNASSPNFPKQFCTDDELQRLIDTISPTPNSTMSKRFLNDELFKRLSASFVS